MSEDVEEIKQNVAVQKALAGLVREGYVEMVLGEDGEPRFRITEKGKKRVEALIARMEGDE